MNKDNCGRIFDWENVERLNRENFKNIREFLEYWQSGQLVINKHIEIDRVYQSIRKIIEKYRTKNQINGRYNKNKEGNNDVEVRHAQSMREVSLILLLLQKRYVIGSWK